MLDTISWRGARHDRHDRHEACKAQGVTVTHPIFDRHGLRHGHAGGAARTVKRDANRDASVTPLRFGVSRTISLSLQHFFAPTARRDDRDANLATLPGGDEDCAPVAAVHGDSCTAASFMRPQSACAGRQSRVCREE
jgi:hypothetical protein